MFIIVVRKKERNVPTEIHERKQRNISSTLQPPICQTQLNNFLSYSALNIMADLTS